MLRSRLNETLQDLRFAGRALRRQPGFAAAAGLTLGFGIGAATVILSVVSGILVRPLPYPDASRAVLIWSGGAQGGEYPLSAANYLDLAAQTATLDRVAAFRSWSHTLTADGEAELLAGARVGAGLFEALGVAPVRGRAFRPEDEVEGSEPVAVLGDGLWRRRFGADPGVIGRQVTLNGRSFTVIGVMPPGFAFPRGAELPSGLQFGARSEIWTPLVLTESERLLRGLQNLTVLASLRPGTSVAAAEADLAILAGRLAQLHPRANARLELRLSPLLETAVAPVRPVLLALLGAVGFLLLIACVNVSNLLLARTAARSREIALRAALGAGRGRLTRQFVAENLLLATLGGVLGVAMAGAGKGTLLALAPAGLPRADDIAIDWRVLAGVLAVVVAIGASFGALAVSQAVGRGAMDALREGARGSGGRSRSRLRQGLVILEVAICVVLLSGAGVLGRTLHNLRRVEPGFEPAAVLAARVTLPLTTSDFSQFALLGKEWERFYRGVTDELGQRPGILAAGVVSSLPLSGAWETSSFAIQGRPPAEPGREPGAAFAGVSDGYFAAMGIPLREGRVFGPADRGGGVAAVVISETMARRYWPGESPIGQRISSFFGPSLEIVGVVGDVRQRDLASAPPPVMYLPLSIYPAPSMTLVVKTAGDPMGEVATVREVIRGLDPGVPLVDPRALEDVLAGTLGQQRFSAILVGGFALAALALAVLGLYGVVSFGVARRTREFGVRLALGAAPAALLAMVVREGVALAAVGLALGLAGALVLGRALTALTYGVRPADPITLGAVSLLLVAVALAASLIPARRATRIELVAALREE